MYGKRIILLFLLSLCTMAVCGQYQYSIDKTKLKQSRRLTIKEYFQKRKQKRIEGKAVSEMAKIDNITDRIARDYEKEKQKEYVRKRMKESRKMAQRYNKGKPPVDFITYIEYKIKRYYGRYF